MRNRTGNEVFIRRVTAGDVSLYKDTRLQALLDSPLAFATTYAEALKRSPESWTEQVEQSASGDRRSTLLAFEGSTPIGMAALYASAQAGKAELLQLWVHPEHRQKGIGRKLVTELIDWGYSAGYKHLYATIHRENVETLPFYERLGFSLDEEATRRAPERDIILRFHQTD